MRKWLVVAVTAVIGLGASYGFSGLVSQEPKHSIKEVMQEAHKPGGRQLLKKVQAGGASDKDRLELLDLYISLTENKPPKGELEDWTGKTQALVVAAAKAVVERKDAGDSLKKAANCGACHKAHKGG